MARLTKEKFLKATDLDEKDVTLPTLEGDVRIRALSGLFSRQATSEALEMVEVRGGQKVKVNTAKLDAIKVQHGLIDPKLDSLEEAQTFMRQCGRAANTLVAEINNLSGIEDDDLEATDARFPDGSGGAEGDE